MSRRKQSKPRSLKYEAGEGRERSPSSDSSCSSPSSPESEGCESSEGTSEGVEASSASSNPYLCQFCDKAFPRLGYLKKHEQSHSQEMPYRCEVCRRLFKHKRSRDRHLKLHTGDRKYRCSQCIAAFSRSDHLKIHMKSHEGGKPYQCSQCRRGYSSLAALTSHLQSHKPSPAKDNLSNSETNSLYCTQCNKVFANKEDYTIHLAEKLHGQTEPSIKEKSPSKMSLQCKSCQRINFQSREDLEKHLQSCQESASERGELNVAELVCTKCNLRCTSPTGLLHHWLLQHPKPADSTSSSSSASQEMTPTDLSVPRRPGDACLDQTPCKKKTRLIKDTSPLPQEEVEYVGGPLLCNQCEATLPDFDSFRDHLKSHLQEESSSEKERRMFGLCSICRLSLPSLDEMVQHITNHVLTTSVELTCSLCQKLFQTGTDLEQHLMEVHAQHLYLCYSCKELFDTRQALQRHLVRKHSVERKKFGCRLCQSSPQVMSESELQLHVRSFHCPGFLQPRQDMSLRCAYCKELHKSRTDLENHMRLHSQSSSAFGRHKCNICDEICPSPTSLAEHKLTHCKVIYGSTCSECKATIRSEESFLSHLMNHNGGLTVGQLSLPASCVVCRQTLVTEAESRLHASFHLQHRAKTLELGRYGDSAEKKQTAAAILLQLDNSKSMFPTNSKSDSGREKENGGEEDWKCNLCLGVLPSDRKLQCHLIEHTFIGCPNFSCYVCGAVFTAAPGLQRHMSLHPASLKPYVCSQCPTKFFFRAQLDNHIFYHQMNVVPPRPADEEDLEGDRNNNHSLSQPQTTKDEIIEMTNNK